MPPLTEDQIKFLDAIKVPKTFGRKETKKTKETWSKEFRQFNVNKEAVRGRLLELTDGTVRGQLLGALGEADGVVLKDPKTPDFVGGHDRLISVDKAVKTQKLFEEATTQVEGVLKAAETALAGKPGNADDIILMRDYVNGRYLEGKAGKGDGAFKAALAAIPKLEKVLDMAAPAVAAAPSGVTATAKVELDRQNALKGPLAALRVQEERFVAVQSRLAAGFVGSPPAALAQQVTPIRDRLQVAEDTAPDVVTQAAAGAKTMLDALDTAMKPVLEARTKYEDARAAFLVGTHRVLFAHPMVADAIVAPGVPGITTGLNEAAVAATAHDYALALTKVETAAKDAAGVVAVADNVGKFRDVESDRLARMQPMLTFNMASTPHQQVKDAVQRTLTMWQEVQDAITAVDLHAIEVTRPNLDALPKAIDDATTMIRLGAEYDGVSPDVWGGPDFFEGKIAAFDPLIQAPIQARIDVLRTTLTNAQVATTGDLRVSCTMLANIVVGDGEIEAKIDEVNDYLAKRAAFDLRQNELLGHNAEPGYVAMTDYENRLANDLIHVTTRLGQAEFALCARVLDDSIPLHAPALQLLADANTYFADRQTLDTEINAINTLANGASASAQIAAVQGLRAEAETARLAGKWKDATSLLVTATGRVANARLIATNADWLDANADPAPIANMAADQAAAFAVFDQAFGGVQAVGGDAGVFAGKSNQARTLRNQAQERAISGDVAGAQTLLTNGVAACKEIMTLVVRDDDFQTQLTELRALEANLVANWNANGYFDPEIAEVKRLLDGAEAHVRAPGFDYDAGMTDLTAARPVVSKVKNTWNAVDNSVAAQARLEQCLDRLKAPAVREMLAPEITQLTGLIDELKVALGGRNPVLAETKANAGLLLIPGYNSMAADGANYKGYVSNTMMPALERLPETRTFSAAERDEVAAIQSRIADSEAARSFVSAIRQIWELERIELQCRALETKGKSYTAAEGPAATQLEALRKRVTTGSAALDSELEALEAAQTAARAEAGHKNYDGGLERIKALVTAMAAVEPKITLQEACLAARKAAGDALTALGKVKDKTVVEPLVACVRGQHANGVAAFNAGDFVLARSIFEAAALESEEAVSVATNVSSYAELANGVAGAPLADGLVKAQGFIEDLKKGEGAMFIFGTIKRAQAALDDAKGLAGSDEPGARAKLTEVMEACKAGRVAAGLYVQLRASESFARDQVTALMSTHPQAGLVRGEAEALLVRLDTAMDGARADEGKRVAAQTEIEAVLKRYYELLAAAEANKGVAALVAEIRQAMPGLEEHKQRHAIAADIDAVQKGLANGQALAEQLKSAEALTLLRKTRDRQVAAGLRAQMESGAPPSVQEIKAFMAKPGGPAALDAIVAGLDPKTQRGVMTAAFEARFGCKLALYKNANFVEEQLNAFKATIPPPTAEQIEEKEQEIKILDHSQNFDMQPDEKAPDLRRFYALMSKLPDAQTLDNDSMKIFTNKGGDAKGSYYSGERGRKEICMCEGEEGKSGYYGVGLPHEIGTVDPGCECQPGESLSYFAWNTLHEVGHAVDDKLGFMDQRGEALAGWKVYGSDVLPIAQKIASKYAFNRDFIAAYMAGTKNPLQPAAPNGVSEEDWLRRRDDAKAHVDRIRSTKNPWQTAASAKLCEIDSVCYQESYPNRWSSYPIAERSKGVSGYQFRAPGEWFSELFAAFHSSKLNAAHPARAWLETLDAP